MLKNIKIYLIFYISLPKPADPRILIFIKKLLELTQNNKYKIKKIIDYSPKTQWYIIKYKRYPAKKNI